jgi:hypothetical protein
VFYVTIKTITAHYSLKHNKRTQLERTTGATMVTTGNAERRCGTHTHVYECGNNTDGNNTSTSFAFFALGFR